MREILFRGKRTFNGEWVKGDYQHFYMESGEYVPYISSWGNYTKQIIPETLGQFSNVKDKNDEPMFEGDIVDVLIGTGIKYPEPVGFKAVVDFKDGAFGIKWNRGVVEEFTPFASYYKPNVTFTVIGNIHDNPELLEV